MTCTRCGTVLEEGDLRCPVCALPTSAAGSPGATREQVLRCSECNASLAYSAERQNPACGFCGAVMQVEMPVDPVERPELQLPFGVSKEQASASLRQWLSTRGFFTPSDLASSATVDSLHQQWWAAWLCDAEALVSWAADSDAGSGRSDWAPHAGQTPMQWTNLLIPASRGLSAEETSTLAAHYDLASAAPAGDGPEVEQFDVQRSKARLTITAALERNAAELLQGGVIPGRRYRKVKAWPLLSKLATRRLVLPAWVVTWQYQDKRFRAVVHGQRASVVVGKTPISWAKVLGVVVGVVTLLATIAAVVVLLNR
ncbi:MAG: zinc ribbon domain-containing protein [Myxococcaceae bacterium]|nr:zinc ribbon domain-containing protein [Myxococcaceae bacterium]